MASLVGEFFLNLIEQDRIWKTREGRVILVEELEPRHRANVLAMLERRIPDLHREWVQEFLDDGVTYRQLAEAGIVAADPAGYGLCVSPAACGTVARSQPPRPSLAGSPGAQDSNPGPLGPRC